MLKGQKVSIDHSAKAEARLNDSLWSLFGDFPLQIVCDVVALVSVQPNGHSPASLGFCLRVPSFEDQFVNIICPTPVLVHSVFLFVS